ncbi:MAG: response regulator transcription factor [Rhodospirillaceae bacterium]|nr:response regulator transcription factor [Rhodospirillaceae bacterium]
MAVKGHGQEGSQQTGVQQAGVLAFVVADDHPMVRDALAAALKGGFDGARISFAGTLTETQAAIESAPETDLLVLDLDMPGMLGLAGLAALRAAHPALPIAIVSASTNSAAMRQAIEMGAAGFIPKLAAADKFLDAVRAILSGALYLPDEARDGALNSRDRDLAQRAAQLTPQQHRVLSLLAEGMANKLIAYEMQISEPTVKAHVTEILRKLGVTSRTQAVILAQRLSLEPVTKPLPATAEE